MTPAPTSIPVTFQPLPPCSAGLKLACVLAGLLHLVPTIHGWAGEPELTSANASGHSRPHRPADELTAAPTTPAGSPADSRLVSATSLPRALRVIGMDAGATARRVRLAGVDGEGPTLITGFSAADTDIPVGKTTTLHWQAAPGFTRITLSPAVGDVTGATTVLGEGSVTVTPANDTEYQLTVEQAARSEQATVRVGVGLTLANTQVDAWVAEASSLTLAPTPRVASWTSTGQRQAASTSALRGPPEFRALGTPAGRSAVRFAEASLVTDGASNPVGGRTELTLALVVRFDPNHPPTTTAAAWDGNHGVVDASDTGTRDDWGTSIRADGRFCFGLGNPDVTVISGADRGLLDGEFHVIVCQWGLTGLRLYVDDAPVVRYGGEVSRNPRQSDLPLALGHLRAGEAQPFAGDLAEVRFFSDAVSADQVARLMEELRVRHGLRTGVPPLRISSVEYLTGGGARVTWDALTGRQYQVHRRNALGAADWPVLATLTAPWTTATYLDFPVPFEGAFYQVSSDVAPGDTVTTVADASEGYHSGTGMTRLPSGHLMVAYRKGASHLSSDGTLRYKLSPDQGLTWGEEKLLYETGDPLWDARDPELTLLQDGRILVAFFKANRLLDAGRMTVCVLAGRPAGNGTIVWDAPTVVPTSFTRYAGTIAKVLELPDGGLLLPVYGQDLDQTTDSAAVVRSVDGGRSWGNQVTISDPGSPNSYAEPNGVILPNGRILLMLRQGTVPKGYYLTHSDDQGLTWSRPREAIPIHVVGKPTLQLLPSGGLLFVGRGPSGTYYATSWDEGDKWSALVKLADHVNLYSSSVLMSGDEVAVAYAYELSPVSGVVVFRMFRDGHGVVTR